MNERAIDLLMTDTSKKPRGFLDGPKVHKADPRVAGFALSYLDAFGYLKDELSAWKDISLLDIKLALGDLQTSLGLKRTKTLTVQTIHAMEAPRCGCPDVLRPRHKCQHELTRRRDAMLPKWKKKGLAYTVTGDLPKVSNDALAGIVDTAFELWAKHTTLAFHRVTDEKKADIVVGPGQGRQSNFDGPGGTLGWASLPNNDRQIAVKLDRDETWTFDPRDRGFCVHHVVRHEIGHALGLTHSRTHSALKSPFYNAAVGEPQAIDDVPRLQARYGPPQNA